MNICNLIEGTGTKDFSVDIVVCLLLMCTHSWAAEINRSAFDFSSGVLEGVPTPPFKKFHNFPWFHSIIGNRLLHSYWKYCYWF